MTTWFEDERDVPHGLVEPLEYPSEVVGSTRRALVYTPPGYDATTERLPVLVLMHGGGGDEQDWVREGRANVILDNLLAEGAMVPMVVVMPAVSLPGGPGKGELVIPTQDQVPAEVLDNLLPAVARAYRIETAPQRRALAGLSMGGFFTWAALLTRPGEFAWYGDFSSGYFPDGLAWFEAEGKGLFDAAAINAGTTLHAIYCDEHDIAWQNNVNTRALFDELGIAYTFIDVPGTTGHTFQTWRLHLHDFAPRLFR